jgi:hypothetical protein
MIRYDWFTKGPLNVASGTIVKSCFVRALLSLFHERVKFSCYSADSNK